MGWPFFFINQVSSIEKTPAEMIQQGLLSGDGGNRTRVREADHTGRPQASSFVKSHGPLHRRQSFGSPAAEVLRADRGPPRASRTEMMLGPAAALQTTGEQVA
jgi:hypothetical protein